MIQGNTDGDKGNISDENLDLKDLFTDYTKGDFTLLANSPLLGKGSNILYSGKLSTDKDLKGGARLSDCTIDIGANEYQGTSIGECIKPKDNGQHQILYVTEKGNGIQDGSSWENAVNGLAYALKWANENKALFTEAKPLHIYIAKGIYKPMYSPEDGYNFTIIPEDLRNKAFLMVENVELYGGFSGKETSLTQRDFKNNETILSGDLIGNDNNDIEVTDLVKEATREDNVYHVVIAANTNAVKTVLNGVTIIGGNANSYSSINVNEVNVSSYLGGGVFSTSTTSSSEINLINSNVKRNSATSNDYSKGGGIYSSSNLSSVVNLINSSVKENSVGSLNYTNNIPLGGGIYSSSLALNSTVNLLNSSITGNSSFYQSSSFSSYGSGIYSSSASSSVYLLNSNLMNNKGFEAISFEEGKEYKLSAYNSVIYGNSNPYWFGDEENDYKNSLIQGYKNTSNGNISDENLDVTTLFTDYANGDYTLTQNSPLVDAGDNALYYNNGNNMLNNKDLLGNARIVGEKIDIGAYERQQPIIITIWENGVWSNGEPTSTKDAILRASYPNDLIAKTLTFEADVTVPSGTTYTVVQNVTNVSHQVVFEHGAYLVQYFDNVPNVGNISFKRQSEPIYRLETLDWSSPVTGQNVLALSPKTLQNRFYRFNETTNNWIANIGETDVFQKGEYIAFRAPNDFNNYGAGDSKVFEGTFTGIPNNGIVTMMLTKNNFGNNAVGNPYPSPIDLKRMISNNSTGMFTISKVFVWTHKNPIVNGEFTGNNWMIYNDQMGWNDPTETSTTIGVGQGFIVQIESKFPQGPLPGISNPMPLIFTTDMRVTGNEVVSYKTQEDDKFWLSFSKDDQTLNSTLIGYKEGSTKQYESTFDSEPMQVYPGIYSLLDQKEMSIQGRGAEFDEQDQVDLAVKTLTDGNYTISLAKTNGIFSQGQSIYLIDKELNKTTDLSKEAYHFISDKGYFTDRFEIVYKNNVLSTNDLNDKNKLAIYTENQTVYIKLAEKLKSLKIYTMEGSLVKSISPINTFETHVDLSNHTKIYVVWVECYNGTKISKKIIVK